MGGNSTPLINLLIISSLLTSLSEVHNPQDPLEYSSLSLFKHIIPSIVMISAFVHEYLPSYTVTKMLG